jgi:hypothetical protein
MIVFQMRTFLVNRIIFNCEDLFKRFQSLLTHFDLDVTYLRVDKELADLSIKELFSDLIWRCCRISNDQFRKDMLRRQLHVPVVLVELSLKKHLYQALTEIWESP